MPNFPISKLAQYVIRNPFTTAASVFAPIFAKNQDRGFFRTALITTPIVFASGALVPKLFGGVRDLSGAVSETRNLLNKSEKYTRFEQPNFNDVNSLFKIPGISENTLEKTLSSYLVSERRSRDFLKEQKTLTKYFNRRFVKTADLIGKAQMGDLEALSRISELDTLHAAKGRLLTNAMHVARRSSLTPLEWSQEPSGVLPNIPTDQMNEWLTSTFKQYKERPDFVRTLKNRLREIKRLNYSGTIAETSNAVPISTFNSKLEFGFGDQAEMLLKKQAPGAYEQLKKAKERNNIRDINIEWAEGVTSGDTGKILNVKVSSGNNIKPLVIPIVDTATGQVRLNANAIGVGNYVIGPDRKPYRIDEWVSKMLAEQQNIPFYGTPSAPGLAEEIASHAYWRAGDPMDSRRMAELESLGGEELSLSAEAIKLRSYGAGVTKLPLFDIGESSPVSFYDYKFDAGKKVDFIKRLLNENRFINMGSEAGVYEGRFQLREAANLSPFGAPSAEKQDPIWRSVTKEFRLTAPEGLPEEAKQSWRSTAWKDLTGSSELPGAKFTVAGINPQDREAIYQEYKNQYPEAVSYLGGMGETGFVLDPKLSNQLQVEGVSPYHLDELGVKAGDVVNPDDVIGFNHGERVLPRFTGIVQDVSQSPDGFVVNIKHELSMQGAKLDIAGIKGMARVATTNEHFTQLRDLVNDYYQRNGLQDFIPSNVNVLAPAEYFTNKVEPAHAYLGIGSDLVSRLGNAGAGDVADKYLQKMSSEGINFQGGQLVINASNNPTTNKEAANRLLRLSQINEEFFQEAGNAIRKAGGYQDPVLNAFVNSGKELGNFMLKNQLPATGFAWDHSLANAPRFSSISYDIETYMALGGNYRGLKAMRNRLQTVSGGDPRQALDFIKYINSGSKGELGITVPISEAFSSSGSLTAAGNRAGSIFDPSIEKYKANFRLDLGGGSYLPVPGTAAYGAESSMFGPGEYQTRPWQHAIQDLASTKDPKESARLQGVILEEYQKQFALGKGSALRPYQYDPYGVPGFLSTTAEDGDPFVARVSKEWASRVHSKRLRESLEKGHDVLGMIQRQPTNELFYMKYRIDPALEGTFDVAVPESVSRALMGDQDKDLVNNILFDANVRMQDNKLIVTSAANQMERDAAEEAIEAMSGKQQKQLQIWQDIKGTDEIARMNTDFELKSLAAKNEKFATAVANRTGVAVNRTAGASIGSYSNVLTEMVEHMVRNPKLMQDPDLVQRLKTGLFDIRQAPISARKAHTAFSLETAMQLIDKLHKGVANENPTAAANQVHSALMSMSRTLSPLGEEGPEYKYWSSQGAEDLKLWAAGRSEKARMMSQVFTTNVVAGKPLNKRTTSIIANAFQDIEGTIGAIHGGRMAEESASKIGAISEHLGAIGRDAASSVTGKIGKIFSEHGGVMALGLGALAALGVAMTPRVAPIASFSRVSSNKYRPDSVVGVPDSIPGEPVAGHMAPSSPPRRIVAAQPGVRTTLVAPMRSTSDLSVQMKATDQSRAAETARILAQIPGSGDTNVTINYRDRTKIRSLRTREKIREITR